MHRAHGDAAIGPAHARDPVPSGKAVIERHRIDCPGRIESPGRRGRRLLHRERGAIGQPYARQPCLQLRLRRLVEIWVVPQHRWHWRIAQVFNRQFKRQSMRRNQETLLATVAPRPFVRAVLEPQARTRARCRDDAPRRAPALAVQRMRIFAPVARQLHRATTEAETAVRNAVDKRHHRKAGHVERIVAGACSGGPEDRAATPVEVTDRAAPVRIQRDSRCLVLQHQKALIDIHAARVCAGLSPPPAA